MLNFKEKNQTSYINFLCNKNFSKIIFCQKSEKNKYEKYINENSSVLYDEDINSEIAIQELLDIKYDLIIVSKILIKTKKINRFLEIIKNISHKDTRLIIYNKSFLNLFIQKIFDREDFNWLNTNELKTYLENFSFTFVRKLKTKIIPINNSFINYHFDNLHPDSLGNRS